MLWVDIVISLILIPVGYISVCCYLRGVKLKELSLKNLKLTVSRAVYLTVGCATVAGLIVCLSTIYTIPLLTRMSLLVLALLILPVAAVDIRIEKIPNVFLLAGLMIRCIVLGVMFIQDVDNAWIITKDSLAGAVVIGLFFLILLLLFKNSIGMGDIKLFALMGFYQGLWGAVNSAFFSLLVSFFVSIAFLITKKKSRKDTIPFGPSIYLGTVIAMCMAGM